jgi:putative Holliday junction resolvase
MSRILCIDYGTQRTGLAVTDPLKIFATSLCTIDTPKLIPFIKEYLLKEPIETFVIGIPKTLGNQPSSNATHVAGFIEVLKKNFDNIPVVEIDERFTTSIARNTIISGGVKKKNRKNKKLVDQISAVLILQTYLEQLGNKQKK